MQPPRGYVALRGHRYSAPQTCYFLTLCTRERRAGLTCDPVPSRITAELHAMEADDAITLRAWVIMPDHVHFFLRLHQRLTLGQVVGRLKAKTRSALLNGGIHWQGNYYEHRLRADDPVEEVIRYLYLNPYRANLVASDQPYPHFGIHADDHAWFRPLLDDDRPFPEWLQ
jgi:putative transposase